MSQTPEISPRAPHQPWVAPGQVDCQVRDLTVTIAADVPVAAAQQRLAEFDQWLPVDGDPDAPVGHLVEHNSTGPLRLGYGAWRDLLLGAQFFNGRDELITAGGRTMKNVAGYDLTKLMVGGRGMFGRLVTITARTYRRPAGALTARAPSQGNLLERIQFLTALLPTDLRPQWALIDGGELTCGYLGDEPALRYYEHQLPQLGFEVESLTLAGDIELRHRLLRSPFAAVPKQPRCRASIPPHRIPDFIREAELAHWIADPAFGIVWAAADSEERALQRAAAVGGSAQIDRADGTFVPPPLSPQVQSLLTRLKSAFDPDARLTALPKNAL